MAMRQRGNRRTKQTPAEAVAGRFEAGWLDRLDNRYGLARELRERYTEVCADLGGVESLSYMQRSLIERGLWLEYWLSLQERELAKGGEFPAAAWVQAVNSLQGIYSRLGLERRAKQVPDLHTYLRQRQATVTGSATP